MSRTAFRPTRAQRRNVSIVAGAGMAHGDIAIALGVSRNTLLKYFAIELEQGAFKCRMDITCALFRAAMRGRGTAAKVYLAGVPQFADRQVASPKAPALGKKQQAQANAGTAHVGTEWDELLGPKPRLQ